MAEGLLVADKSPIFARAVAGIAGPRLDLEPSRATPPEHLRDPMPAPKLVVLDPGQVSDLGEIVSHLTDLSPETRIVAFAERPSLELARYCIEIGCHGFLPKSADSEMLLRALRVVLDGGSYIDRIYSRKLMMTSADAMNGRALSWREEHILRDIARGHSASQIADELSLSVKTVDTYRTRAMKKLDLDDRAALVRMAVARGWLS